MTQNYYSSQSKALQTRNDWFFSRLACVPNAKLDWVTKGVVVGISQEFIRLGIPHTQLMKIWYPNVADHSGLSVQTVNGSIMKLVRAHAIVKEVKKEPDKVTKEKKKRVWIAFTPEFLADPGSLFVEAEESNYGGNRTRRHKKCGGEIVNTCTLCGATNIPEKDIYYTDDEAEKEETPSDGKQLLAELDALIAATDNYYDAADIPDDVVDAMGGADQALTASPREIAQHMAIPRYIREGLEDEDLALADEILSQLNKEKGK